MDRLIEYLDTVSPATLYALLGLVAFIEGIFPPMPAYSPSEFSRTQIMSMSAAPRFASGEVTPGNNRIGRRFTY